jgi:hypothetical protein
MKTYTRRRGRCRRQQRQTRSKKYLKTRRQRSRYGGVSKRPSATPSLGLRQSSRTRAPPPPPPPSRSTKPSGGVVVLKDGVPVSQSRGRTPSRAPSRAPPKTSLRNAGILKKQISKDDTQALQAARIIANFPQDMDKFLQIVINNYELLNYEGVKFALRQQISINNDPAVGRLSTNGIIFISYICGKLVCLLNELSTLPKSEVAKKSEILHKIKQIEKVICLLDGVGCSWGIRPYNQTEMDMIAEYYVQNKNVSGLQEYHRLLSQFIDKYFPVLKKYTNPSHVVSSSMCRRLIPGNIIDRLPTISESVYQPMEVEEID